MPAWFRWLAYVMAALFAFSVAVQYNDPDPLRWMAIYGAAMVLSVLLPHRKGTWIPALVVGAVALAWALVLVTGIWDKVALSDVVKKMDEYGGAVEEEREAGGLLIEAAWLLPAALFRWKRRA